MLHDQLIEAIEQNDLELVKHLVLVGADIRADNDTAIRVASLYGFLEIIKYLVSFGANIRANDDCAVKQASLYGHLETVKYLVSLGANTKADDDFAVKYASKHGHLNVVKYLVSIGANVRTDAVKYALGYNHLDIVKYLVLQGADVNVLSIGKINELVTSSYNSGDFDYAIKLSKHKHYANDAIKKSLAKIQKNREYFVECLIGGIKYANVCIVTRDSNRLFY